MGHNREVTLSGTVEHLHCSPTYSFQKASAASVRLVAGIGIEGDVHAGATVRHQGRVAADPSQPNLRQVHLIHGELHDELRARGFDVGPGEMGENITTRGLDLLGLPAGTVLLMGGALVAVTGLRNPCVQLDTFSPGLRGAVLDRDADGRLVRKGGVMGVVVLGGDVRVGDAISVSLPPPPHVTLEPV